MSRKGGDEPAGEWEDPRQEWEAEVHRLVQAAFPNPPTAGFADELSRGILESLCQSRPADPAARIGKIIEVAKIMARHDDGLSALYEFAALMAPEIAKQARARFSDWPELWEEIRDEFVRKLSLRPLHPEQAAQATAFATRVSRRLALDLLQRRASRPEVKSRTNAAGGWTDPLQAVADPVPLALPPEPPAVLQARARIEARIRQLAFRCPPNPPHQALAWAYKQCLGRGPTAMISQGLVDLPLEELLQRFLERVARDRASVGRWAESTAPLREALARQVGGVLLDGNQRRLYKPLLSRSCAQTCLRDYALPGAPKSGTTGATEGGPVVPAHATDCAAAPVPGAATARLAGSTTGPARCRTADERLEGQLSDWIVKVSGRMSHEIVRLFFDPADQAAGQSPTGGF